jgi:hypothetical protein
MFIVILEDDQRREDAMRRCLGATLPQYQPKVFCNSRELCSWLDENLENVILLSLDHDLAVTALPDGRLVDQGTGLEVARHLARHPSRFPVVLHSSNSERVARMGSVLRKAGWQTHRVVPFNDLAWVRREWRTCVRDAVVGLAAPSPRPVPGVPPRVAALLQSLGPRLAASEVGLEAAEDRLLCRWLTHALKGTRRLMGHVNWLRDNQPHIPGVELLSWQRVRQVLRSGLRALGPDELVELAFNPVALFELHDRIRDRRPPWWRKKE